MRAPVKESALAVDQERMKSLRETSTRTKIAVSGSLWLLALATWVVALATLSVLR